ncbi:MAG TPA: hypothetical protein VK171_13695 [Fimbriimonas sp.]|nr:hypothetical protein [Fimbriimonas sp.]
MIQTSNSQSILNTVRQSPLRGFALRKFAMEQLDTLPTYDWSGIYRLAGDTLVLDAYVGAHTDHTRIPVGRGVCGTAVAEDANQVIDDVRELSNYLSCSIHTRSEIVVLIRAHGSELRAQDFNGVSSAEQLESAEQGAASAVQPEQKLVAGNSGVDETEVDTSTPEQRLVADHKQDELPTSDFQPQTILGQIDIDGHQVGAFDASDEEFLTELGKILAERWE